jgi:hypothetical protein
MPLGRIDDDVGDGERERESERKCDRKYTAINSTCSSELFTCQRALLIAYIDSLLGQLESRDMVRWTQQDWLTFRTHLRSLASLVKDVLGRVPDVFCSMQT